MKTHLLELPIIVKKFDQHQKLKTKILFEIEKMGKHSMHEPHNNQCISNTDWHLHNNYIRPYLDTVSPIFDNIAHELKKDLDLVLPQDISITNCWFQQYEHGDYHDWHVHLNCFYSIVYYVELPNAASKTSFNVLGKEIEYDVVEGDILCFPGLIPHRSKCNLSPNRKTVLTANSIV